mmetsp:Transcript_10023/g.14699  ORF Transcript_10023/g.14699 Transcript_10023/m.14699 type:complete len:449 (-) Transcript_10023:296-1642(-)
MKVKTISRSAASTQRETSGDVRIHHRNLNPAQHPMQRAREYTRAVTAAKIDRMFAKPFIGSLGNGHRDGITATAVSRVSLAPYVSGSADGEVCIWDLASRSEVGRIPGAHSRMVTGLAMDLEGRKFFSCSDDGHVKLWNLGANNTEAEADYRINGTFKSIDHHWTKSQFATASDSAVDIWDPTRTNSPLQSYNDLWGSDDTVTVIRYNPAESYLAATASADRGIGLFDTRSSTPLKKTMLSMRSNCLRWNPMEPNVFVVGNEDYNAYSFDMRRLDQPAMIHKGHVGAIMDVAWSPTGREFVTASYDKTIRIFGQRSGTARDVYHLKRMQRIWCVNYTQDNDYILSGSDDSNIRIWKAQASKSIGQSTTREETAVRYRQTLIKKYSNMPEIQRIHKSRKVPKLIKKQTALAQIQKEKVKRKESNVVKHSKPGSVQFKSERKSVVVKQVD